MRPSQFKNDPFGAIYLVVSELHKVGGSTRLRYAISTNQVDDTAASAQRELYNLAKKGHPLAL